MARIHHATTGTDLSIKAGMLDDTPWLTPREHYWTQRKQPWLVIPDGATCVEDDG